MRSSIISLGLAGVIGVMIGLLLQSPPPPPSATASNDATVTAIPAGNRAVPPAAPAGGDLAALQQQLQQEIVVRTALQEKVKKLDQRLAALVEKTASNAKDDKPSSTRQADSPHTTSRPKMASRAWFDSQALIDAGLDAATAQQLKARFEKQELDRLYLRDQAIREGWFGSKRYREEVKKLDARMGDLQDTLGDETYAAYLYATGQSNRVAVQSVLSGSAADQAGLRSDDQILRYGDKRIYNWRDLRTATTEGDVGETVALAIVRDGKPMTLYVQRGPLGIRMNSISVAP